MSDKGTMNRLLSVGRRVLIDHDLAGCENRSPTFQIARHLAHSGNVHHSPIAPQIIDHNKPCLGKAWIESKPVGGDITGQVRRCLPGGGDGHLEIGGPGFKQPGNSGRCDHDVAGGRVGIDKVSGLLSIVGADQEGIDRCRKSFPNGPQCSRQAGLQRKHNQEQTWAGEDVQ